MSFELDIIYRKILNVLQEDGRTTIADLAKKVGLSPSPSPCLRRVRMLEDAGVVARYVAVLDQQLVGLPVSVFVSIKLESQREEALGRFAKAIRRWPEVLECYLMTGPRDYLSIARGRVKPCGLRALPKAEAHAAERNKLDRIKLRA